MHPSTFAFTPPKGTTQLLVNLREVQSRLGTQKEQPGDLDLAREIGHTVRNKATVATLSADLDRLRATRC